MASLNAIDVPTLDEDVRKALVHYNEPVEVSGETNAQRRERLITLVRDLGPLDIDSDEDMDDEEDDEEFYTPGPDELYDTRIKILHNSLECARERVQKLRSSARTQDLVKTLRHRRAINAKLARFEAYGSQVITGNTRAVSAVRFSPQGLAIACGSWDGRVYVLDSTNLTTLAVAGGHTEKASALDWSRGGILVSGGQEGKINVWGDKNQSLESRLKSDVLGVKENGTLGKNGTLNINGTLGLSDNLNHDSNLILSPSLTIDGHNDRITQTLYHPHLDLVASTSLDQTWKLWDVNRATELVQQEGHSQGVFSGAFHVDGLLFASGGLDGIVRLWDLRSGRAISTLTRHIQGVYSLDWSPNGRYLASASGDCSVKVWDVRKLQHGDDELFSIPAHTKLVSCVRFYHRSGAECLSDAVSDEHGENTEVLDSSGTFLATSSYDGTVALWSADNWVRVASLVGHTGKVMSCDVIGNGEAIVSSGWDRLVKLWKKGEGKDGK